MNSRWSLVVHDVGVDYVHVWFGSLFQNEKRFQQVVLKVSAGEHNVQAVRVCRDDFERPFTALDQRFYKKVKIEGLTPNTDYQLELSREAESIGEYDLPEAVLCVGSFKTLPASLGGEDDPFVVALGSCFYAQSDNGHVAEAYQALVHQDDLRIRPDVKFLTGDQVYLDIGADSLSPIASEIPNRIADDYAASWQKLSGVLRNGATWMLADDHEYWNNYPDMSGVNPYLWMIVASDRVRNAWQQAADDGVKQVQGVLPLRTFSIGSDIAFCLVDVRCQREDQRFLPDAEFEQLITWIENLQCPGVLVFAQPLIVQPGGSQDKSLANFTKQYQRLIHALSASGNDVLVLAGDVHYGRIAAVDIGEHGAVMHEVISSPMANITGMDGKMSCATVEHLEEFPAIAVPGVAPRPVSYKTESVEKQDVGSWLGIASHTKTKEHFCTLAFSREQDKVVVDIQAWKVRERDDNGLPQKQFTKAHQIILSGVSNRP